MSRTLYEVSAGWRRVVIKKQRKLPHLRMHITRTVLQCVQTFLQNWLIQNTKAPGFGSHIMLKSVSQCNISEKEWKEKVKANWAPDSRALDSWVPGPIVLPEKEKYFGHQREEFWSSRSSLQAKDTLQRRDADNRWCEAWYLDHFQSSVDRCGNNNRRGDVSGQIWRKAPAQWPKYGSAVKI